MKLLIDANILLDVLQNRAGFVEDSSLVWKLCETGQAEGIVSARTFANLVYVMRKELAPEKIEEVCKLLSLIFHFADFSVSDMNRAAEMKWKDFEDAIQSATAVSYTHLDVYKRQLQGGAPLAPLAPSRRL